VIAGYPGDGVSLVQLTSDPITGNRPRDPRPPRCQCWHCSEVPVTVPPRDAVFADLEIEPITEAEAVQIYQAVMIGRPVRPGLVARLWKHAQLWRS